MSVINNQRKAAKQFVSEWAGKGYEKGETQRFWIDLPHSVFGIDNPTKMMEFELPVKTITKGKGSDFIDAYIHSTKVLIEQKGSPWICRPKPGKVMAPNLRLTASSKCIWNSLNSNL